MSHQFLGKGAVLVGLYQLFLKLGKEAQGGRKKTIGRLLPRTKDARDGKGLSLALVFIGVLEVDGGIEIHLPCVSKGILDGTDFRFLIEAVN